MKLTFAFSPCPNDSFMFEPIVSRRIDTEGLRFDIHLADVEELNQSASAGIYDITKLSFNAYTKLTSKYQLLNSGSALGRKCGPLLISKKEIAERDLDQSNIAIPGKNTTANFLLSFAYPEIQKKREMIFSDIERSINSGESDAGVIIHENRFTYEEKGFRKIKDLGDFWEESTGFPIPLGGIVTRREYTEELKQKIDRVIARSVAYALDNPQSGKDYIKCHAQEMDESVMQSHINLYVNEFSRDIGVEGKKSIYYLFENHPDVDANNYEQPLFVIPSETTSGESLSDSYWSSLYQNKKTGWDVGDITPPIKKYVNTLTDKSISILIPGAGNSHEAEYLHRNGFTNVSVCDLASEPLQNLLERCPTFPKNNLILGNFFDLESKYDLIIEQTFFCALDPQLREKYASKMKSLLSENGKLVGLMFDIEFPFEGPPFGGKKEKYKTLFSKHFDHVKITEEEDSIAPRAGNEIFVEIS